MSRAPPGQFLAPTPPSITSPSRPSPAKKPRKRPPKSSDAGEDTKPAPKKRQRKAPSQTPGTVNGRGESVMNGASRSGSITASRQHTPSEVGGAKRGGKGISTSRFSRAGTAASAARSHITQYDDDTTYGSQDEEVSGEEEQDEGPGSEEDDAAEEEDRGINVDEQVVWDREDRLVEKEMEAKRRRDKALDDAADPSQLARINFLNTNQLNHKVTQRFVKNVIGQKKCSDDLARALSAVAKVHVGEIVEAALAIQIEYNDPVGPLTPAHILEAYRRYKLKVTSGMGSHPRLGMGLVGGGGAGSGVAGVRKRGPFGGS